MKEKLLANVVTFSSLIGMNGMTVLADEVNSEEVINDNTEKKEVINDNTEKKETQIKEKLTSDQELKILESAYKSLESKLKTETEDAKKVSIKVQLLVNKEKQTLIQKKINMEKKLAEEKEAKEKEAKEKEAKEKEAKEKEAELNNQSEAVEVVTEQVTYTPENTVNQTMQSFAPASTYPVASNVNTYPWGQCTWGVKELAPWVGNYWGNANQWAATAASLGFEVGTEPRVGSVAVWSGNHVAYVTDVASSDAIQVLESNVNGMQGIANYRGWINPKVVQGHVLYIYPK